jgi:hypothetical protein
MQANKADQLDADALSELLRRGALQPVIMPVQTARR